MPCQWSKEQVWKEPEVRGPCPFVQTLFAIRALPAVIHTLVTQETAQAREWAEANIVGCPHKRSLEVAQITKGVVEPLCTVGSWDSVQLEDLATARLPLRARMTVGSEVLVHVVLTLRLLRSYRSPSVTCPGQPSEVPAADKESQCWEVTSAEPTGPGS